MRANIDAILNGIENGRLPVWNVPRPDGDYGWRFQASAGVQYDTNINAGPDIDSIFIYGLPFQLSEDAKGQSDWTGLLRLSANHSGKVGGYNWASNISLNGSKNSEFNSLDNAYLTASSGPNVSVNPRLSLSVPLTADIVKYGTGKHWYSNSVGIAPQLRYKKSDRMMLNLGVQLAQKKFKLNGDRDTSSLSGSLGVIYQMSQKDVLRLHFTAGQEDSGIEQFSNDVTSVGAAYSHIFNDLYKIDVQASLNNTKFKAAQAGYAAARDDESLNGGINLTRKIRDDLSAVVSFNHTKNESNLDLYNYERDRISFRIVKEY